PARGLESHVRLIRRVCLLLRACLVPGRELRHRIHHRPAGGSHADHEEYARAVPGADEDVLRLRRRVEEVPRAEPTLLALDEQHALTGENEEVFLRRLGVVQAVRLTGRQHVESDAELPELGSPALERALRARRLTLAVLGRQPLGFAYVHDEPALASRREA